MQRVDTDTMTVNDGEQKLNGKKSPLKCKQQHFWCPHHVCKKMKFTRIIWNCNVIIKWKLSCNFFKTTRTFAPLMPIMSFISRLHECSEKNHSGRISNFVAVAFSSIQNVHVSVCCQQKQWLNRCIVQTYWLRLCWHLPNWNVIQLFCARLQCNQLQSTSFCVISEMKWRKKITVKTV